MRTIWRGRRIRIDENNGRYAVIINGVQIAESLTMAELREMQADIGRELGSDQPYRPRMQTKGRKRASDKAQGPQDA